MELVDGTVKVKEGCSAQVSVCCENQLENKIDKACMNLMLDVHTKNRGGRRGSRMQWVYRISALTRLLQISHGGEKILCERRRKCGLGWKGAELHPSKRGRKDIFREKSRRVLYM